MRGSLGEKHTEREREREREKQTTEADREQAMEQKRPGGTFISACAVCPHCAQVPTFLGAYRTAPVTVSSVSVVTVGHLADLNPHPQSVPALGGKLGDVLMFVREMERQEGFYREQVAICSVATSIRLRARAHTHTRRRRHTWKSHKSHRSTASPLQPRTWSYSRLHLQCCRRRSPRHQRANHLHKPRYRYRAKSHCRQCRRTRTLLCSLCYTRLSK